MRPSFAPCTLLLVLLVVAGACGSGTESTPETAEPEPRATERDADTPPPEGDSGAGAGTPGSEADAGAGEEEEPATTPAPTTAETDPLLDPDSPEVNHRAPDRFRARFETTAGDFVVEVHRDWAPRGADRFFNLVRAGFYDDTYFFRVVEGFVVQFGVSGDPEVNAAWSWVELRDDPVLQANERGTLTFATAGPNTRTTQVFINLGDNTNLDSMGFAPFGRIVEGMDVVESLYSGYGDGPPFGPGPDQGRLEDEGNVYVEREFPELDRIIDAEIL